MDNWQERTEMLLGAEGAGKLRDAHVAVIGVGTFVLVRRKYR